MSIQVVDKKGNRIGKPTGRPRNDGKVIDKVLDVIKTGTGNNTSEIVLTGEIMTDESGLKQSYSERNVDVSAVSFLDESYRESTSDDLQIKYYKKDDTVRACVDAIAVAAVQSGYHFEPIVPGEKVNKKHQIILQRFFADINEEDTGEDLLFDTFMDLPTYGDALWERTVSYRKLFTFIEFLNNPKGDPWEIDIPYKFYHVTPYYTRPIVDKYTGKITRYRQVDQGGNVMAEWKRQQIIHFRMSSPIDEIMGLAPSATLDQVIAANIYANDYNGKFFENNATPRLHINLGKVSPDELKFFKGKVEKELKGQPHRNLITRGNVTVNPIGLKGSDMEFDSYVKLLMRRIMAIYRVPPVILGYDEWAKGTSAREQISLFKFMGVEPWRRIVASRINKKIIKPLFPGIKMKFVFNPVDRLDVMEQARVDRIDLESGVKVINEVREARGMGKAPHGDKMVPMPGQRIPGQTGRGNPDSGKEQEPDEPDPDKKSRRKDRKKKK